MLGFHYTSIFVVGTWAPLAVAHVQRYGSISLRQLMITLFNSINLMICLWELCLYFHQKHIQQTFANLKKKYALRDVPYTEALFSEVPLSKVEYASSAV